MLLTYWRLKGIQFVLAYIINGYFTIEKCPNLREIYLGWSVANKKEDFGPFEAGLVFEAPTTQKGLLV